MAFVSGKVSQWKVKFWCATLETNSDGTLHAHMTLQFFKAADRIVQSFCFEGARPNAAPNDLLGEGWCKRRLQESIDRAMFYVWADKIGTARTASGEPCVAGNYAPAWTGASPGYVVKGAWLDKLFRAYKLTPAVYEDYVFLSRDGVVQRKRNLDACQARAEEAAQRKDIEERTKRIQSNPALYKPFGLVPEAEAWLARFQVDALRYPLLIVHAPSYTGKTEWANSLFSKALELKVGCLKQFPEGMRSFNRKVHQGLVLDDVRDLDFVVEHQEKLQGKYNSLVEFGTTAGGTCAYWRDLYKVPVVITINNSTRNLELLAKDDFLSNPSNVVLLCFSGRPGEQPPQTKWPPVFAEASASVSLPLSGGC